MPLADKRMPSHLLFATDLSARCDRAQDRTIALARSWGAKITVAHALDGLDAPNDQASRPTASGAEQRARRLMQAAFADAADVVHKLEVRAGKPATVALDVAAETGCDLIVTGIAGNSPLGQTMLGSTVTALSRRAAVPVLVVKKRARGDYSDVLVASDFSEASKSALETAQALFGSAEIVLFNAYEAPFMTAHGDGVQIAVEDEARAFLGETDAEDLGVVVVPGEAAVALADHVAESDSDLVVIGSHGKRGLMTVLLGSTAIAVLDEVPCDVLVVPMAGRQVDG